MSFDWLYSPAERIDQHLAAGLDGVGLVLVLVLAALLGLRHATDPDHLVAVTALAADEERTPGDAARLGAWWGMGHAAMLLVVGLPLIAAGAVMPHWLEKSAETVVGLVIMGLAVRVLVRWWRARSARTGKRLVGAGQTPRTHVHAAAIGMIHGLGGTGAVTILLLGLLPDREQAALALTVFAPMSVVSMAVCTYGYGRVIRRAGRLFAPGGPAMPLLGLFALAFGSWFAGLI